VTTIERVGIKKDTGKVVDYVREYDCGTVVVGLPLNLNGTDSVQTEKVRAFKEKLENKLRSMALQDVQVVFQDERFTTKLAEQVLIDGGVRRENRKKYVDKQAAVLILQSYLDSQPHQA
jgi:putative Holliday junction resolvase